MKGVFLFMFGLEHMLIWIYVVLLCQKLKHFVTHLLKMNLKNHTFSYYLSTAKTEPLIASYFPFSKRTPVVLMRMPRTGFVKHLATLTISIIIVYRNITCT